MTVFTVFGVLWSAVLVAVGVISLAILVVDSLAKRRRAGPTNLRLVRGDEEPRRARFSR